MPYARPAPDRTSVAQTFGRFVDTFGGSAVGDASRTVSGSSHDYYPDYWQAVTPANTSIYEGLLSSGRLEMSAMGSDAYNAAELRGVNDATLNFFAQPVQIKLTGIEFDLTGGGNAPYRHLLTVSINSTRENWWDTPSSIKLYLMENERVSLSGKANDDDENPENVNEYVAGGVGESGDITATLSSAPDNATLRLDRTSYHLEVADSSGNAATFSGEHGLTQSAWGKGFHLCIEGRYNDATIDDSPVASTFGIGEIEVENLVAFDAFQNGSIISSGHTFRQYTSNVTNTDTAPTSADGLVLTADGTGTTRESFVISDVRPQINPFSKQQTFSGDVAYSGTAASGKQVFKFGYTSEQKTPTAAADCIEVHLSDSGAWAVYEKANAAGTDPSSLTAVDSGNIGATPTSFSLTTTEDYFSLTLNGSRVGEADTWAGSTAYSLNNTVYNDTGRKYICVQAGTSAGSGGPTGTGDDITDGTAKWDFVQTGYDHGFRDSGDSSVTNPAYKFGTASSFNQSGDAAYFFAGERDENTANTAVITLTNFAIEMDTEEQYAPTVFGTVGDGITLSRPKLPRAQSKAKYGYIDITKAPFYADPTGVLDSTAPINLAIRFGIDHNLMVYVPAGTYKVTDTIGGIYGYQKRRIRTSGGDETTQWNGPVQIYGSYAGARPKFKLAANSDGFDNTIAAGRKPVVELWAQKYSADWKSGENDMMCSYFMNIDIEVESGNPGAIGIRFQGAQQSITKDVCVILQSGYTCFEGVHGSGGLTVNCHAMGGQFGFDMEASLKPKFVDSNRNGGGAQPCPVLIGCIAEGQVQYPIRYQGPGSLVLVGCEIYVTSESTTNTAVSVPLASYNTACFKGTVNAIDTRIEFEDYNAANTAFDMGYSIFLQNVYVNKAGTGSGGIVVFDGSAVKGASSSTSPTDLTGYNGWKKVTEFAEGTNRASSSTGGFGTYRYIHSVFIDGERGFTEVSNTTTSSVSVPSTLRTAHIPTLPHFEEAGTLNAMDYGAVGDGITDDTTALQDAIDAAEAAGVNLFLPKGYFKVRDKLDVDDCKIVGVGPGLSQIIAREEVVGIFDNDASPTPLIQTTDSATKDPTLCNLTLHAPSDVAGAYCLRQRAGLATVFNVQFADRNHYGYGGVPSKPSYGRRAVKLVHYSGNAGGWFGPFVQGDHWEQKADTRQFYGDGLREALNIYSFNPEHTKADAQTEFNDCRNFNIFGVKSEAPYCSIWMSNGSQDFNVYGYAGNKTGIPAAEFNATDWHQAGGDEHDYHATNPAPSDLDYSLTHSIYRIDADCDNYRFTTVMPSGCDGAGYQNVYVRGFDPNTWPAIWDDAKTESPADETPALDRPVLYKRGSPP